MAIELWNVKVKKGQEVHVSLEESKVLHVVNAHLRVSKHPKDEYVSLRVKLEGQKKKFDIASLHPKSCPQQLFDLVFPQSFTLSHTGTGTVYFQGYTTNLPADIDDDLSLSGDYVSDEGDVGPVDEVKQGQSDLNDGDYDEGDVGSDDEVKQGQSDLNDGGDDEFFDSSDEEEETPKKQNSGKKRPNEYAPETSTTKKAKHI